MGGVRILVAALVIAHGVVYLNATRGVLPVFEGWKGRSWLLGDAVTGDRLKRLALALWAGAGAGTVAAGVLLALAPLAGDLWRSLAIGASLVGMASFPVFWGGDARRLFDEGGLGVVLSLALLLLGLQPPEAFLGR